MKEKENKNCLCPKCPITPAIHEILANQAFTVTDGPISQLFVVAFVYSAYV